MAEGEVIVADDELKEAFGDYLRRHREASGKTLDGISRTTRIAKRFLQAFEDNNAVQLPDHAFARGFLKAYAKEVGLDVEDCIARYDRFQRSLMPTQIKEIRKPVPTATTAIGESIEQIQKQKYVVWGLTAGVIVAGVVAGVLLLIEAIEHRASVNQAQRKAALSELAIPDENIVEPPPTTSQSEPEVAPVAKEPQRPAVSNAKAAESQAALSTPVKPSSLTIKALKPGKLSIRVDDHAAQELDLKLGDSETLSIFKDVEIRMSDRSAFSFQYNSKPLDISGPVIKLFNRHLFNKKQ